MPHLLKRPSHPKVIRDRALHGPPPHALVVLSRPFQNLRARYHKLRAADAADLPGHGRGGDVEELHVHVGEVRADVVPRDVDFRGVQGVDADGTAGVEGAAQVDIAALVYGVETEVFEEGDVGGPEEVVVPLGGAGVDEGCVGGQARSVVVDYVG